MGCRRMLGVQDRVAIMAGLEAGLSQARIARLIRRSPLVVCREIARHAGPDGAYRAEEPVLCAGENRGWAKLVAMVIEVEARVPDLPCCGRWLTRRHPSLPGVARLHSHLCSGDRRSARVRQTWESRGACRRGGRQPQSTWPGNINRIRQANSPACVDGCGVGLDLCGRAGLYLGGTGYRRHCCSFRYLHKSPKLGPKWVLCGMGWDG